MRSGILISAGGHVALVALALLGTPTLFESVPMETIEVDLVPPQEAEPPPKEPEKKPDKSAEWNPLPEASAAQTRPLAPEASGPHEAPASQAKAKPSPSTQQARAPQSPPAGTP